MQVLSIQPRRGRQSIARGGSPWNGRTIRELQRSDTISATVALAGLMLSIQLNQGLMPLAIDGRPFGPDLCLHLHRVSG